LRLISVSQPGKVGRVSSAPFGVPFHLKVHF
jgi:hypothetical protein